VRWLSAGTEGRVDQVFLRPGARVRANTVILQLSNADVVREIADAELAMQKSEAELANLRVQLQAQLLNERALEAQLESEATQAQLGTAMSAKISRARADSLATRLKIEREKLGIAEEAREAQLIAKQAEVAQMQALYDLRSQQRKALLVRAGMEGMLEEVSVGTGQQVGSGTILARVANTSRLMARIHVPEAQAGNVDISQPASITLQDRSYAAKVVHVDPNVQNGIVSIDLKFAGPQPHEARTDLSASGAIEVEKIPSASQPRLDRQRASQARTLPRRSDHRLRHVRLAPLPEPPVEVAALDCGDPAAPCQLAECARRTSSPDKLPPIRNAG
jgi:HlyD family secretion protein